MYMYMYVCKLTTCSRRILYKDIHIHLHAFTYNNFVGGVRAYEVPSCKVVCPERS